ncbi:MAG: hypothetical protein JWO48_2660 [Bryobacterales bacterium]|nr:hypothetical protein [Bryobacterales bacterium]
MEYCHNQHFIPLPPDTWKDRLRRYKWRIAIGIAAVGILMIIGAVGTARTSSNR